ncbi:MAG: hypothetical protein KC635_00040 [Myxococcales bacterium]|nr:hypothetical protein [Myxococcales bacterium]MCB9735810.1 hypothetical protein [Deltaproteobacteria bacterium]
MQDIALECDGEPGAEVVIDPDGDGNLPASQISDPGGYVFGAASYRGEGAAGGATTRYWNVAIGVDASALAAGCVLTTEATADDRDDESDGVYVDGALAISGGVVYPFVAWRANLGTCTQHAVNAGAEVTTAYTRTTDGDHPFAHGYSRLPYPPTASGAFAGEEVARVQYAGGSAYVALAGFGDGTLAVFNRDTEAADSTRLAIYDSGGSELLAPTEFEPVVNFLAATSLPSGDVAVAYQFPDDQSGRVAVFDASGDAVLAPTQFARVASPVAALAAFPDGNMLALIRGQVVLGDASSVWAVVVAPNGAATAQTALATGSGQLRSGATIALPTGDVLVAYLVSTGGPLGSTDVRAAVIAADGSVVGDPTTVGAGSGNQGVVAAAALGGGLVALFYQDGNRGGAYVVVDAAAAVVAGPTVFLPANSSPFYMSATDVAGGGAIVTYRRGAGNATEYQRVDATGALVGAPVATLPGGAFYASYSAATTLSDGTTVLAYARTPDGDPPYPAELLFLR